MNPDVNREQPAKTIVLRDEIAAADRDAVRGLVRSTGVFSHVEVEVAVELVDECLAEGRQSGYEFIFAEKDGSTVGYACYGPIPLTQASYDLYWIAVAPDWQGSGVGQKLMVLAEAAVARRGGGGLYIETSSRDVYDRTRRFYRRAGYRQVARLRDFYAQDDHKLVFCKTIPSAH